MSCNKHLCKGTRLISDMSTNTFVVGSNKYKLVQYSPNSPAQDRVFHIFINRRMIARRWLRSPQSLNIFMIGEKGLNHAQIWQLADVATNATWDRLYFADTFASAIIIFLFFLRSCHGMRFRLKNVSRSFFPGSVVVFVLLRCSEQGAAQSQHQSSNSRPWPL